MLILRVFLLIVLGAVGARAGDFVVQDGFKSGALGRVVEVAYDATGALSLADVRGGAVPFAATTEDVPSFGYRVGAEWVRFSIDDRRGPGRDPLVLELAHPVTDFADVITESRDGRRVTMRAGDRVDHRTWPLDARIPSFPIAPDAVNVWIRVEGQSSPQIPLTIFTRDAWHVHTVREDVAQALYYGALGAMLIYNILVWAAVGLRLYGFYVWFLGSYGLLSLALNGILFSALAPGAVGLGDYITLPAMASLSVGAAGFTVGLLDLGPWRCIATGVAKLLSVLFAALVCLSPAIPFSVGVRSGIAMDILLALLLVVAGVYATARGERAGRWFLMAWTAFLTGALVFVLRATGVLPNNAFTTNAHQVGSAIEFLLLSFALADRIKQLQAEATRNAELAAASAELAREASVHALKEQERANLELRRLDALKDEFLANASHELRTPLNGIIGMAEALEESRELPPALRARSVDILGAARKLSALVSTIVDFGGSRPDDAVPILVPLDLAAMVSRALDECRRDHAAKNLRVVAEIPPNASTVLGVEHALIETLRAVVGNAFKFTAFGAVEVRARRDGDVVELVVIDEGVGIEAARLPFLFRPFEQGDGSATRQHGGTGLGLALAKKFTENMRGTISIDSQPRVGTTVTLRFIASDESSLALAGPASACAGEEVASGQPGSPDWSDEPASGSLARVESLRPAAIASRGTTSVPPPPLGAAAGPARARRARVLVVDDDPLNRRVVAAHLRTAPFDLVEAVDGPDALDAFANRGPFDAVLLDVMMPGMSGYEVCRRMRESASATDVPILMLTARQQVGDLIEGFEAGANDYVHKPIGRGELRARLSAHVSLARASLAMRRFVPRETIRLLGFDDLTDVSLGDAAEQYLTVAFSDVRGFTATAERLTPKGVFEWLNRCYGVVGPEVRRNAGFIDKYIGDAVMALFPRSPADAVRAAVAMQRGLDALGDIRLGTGIHVGSTMLGTLGEAERFEATVLSDAVNVASRVEGASKFFGARVLVTGEVRARSAGFHWRSLGAIRLKGRSAPVDLHELLDADPAAERDQKLALLTDFVEALESFRSGRLREAAARFRRITDENPNDGPAQAFLAHTTRLIDAGDGTAEAFDGTFVLAEK